MATLGSGNRVSLLVVAESTLGTTPTNPTLETLNILSTDVNFSLENVQSATIRSDRKRTALINVSKQAGGGFAYELQKSTAFENLLAGVMFNTATSVESVAASDISAASSDNSFSTVGEDFSGFVKGQWIRVTGFTESANNGLFMISHTVSTTTSKIVLESGQSLTTESAGDAVVINNDGMLTDGTTKKSFTLSKRHADVTQNFNFTGMVPNAWSLSLAQGSVPSGDFNFLGTSSARTTTGFSGETVNAASTNDSFNPVDNVGTLRIDNTALSGTAVTSISFNVGNNLESLFGLGSAVALDVREGSVDVSGDITIFFADGALYDKYVDSDTLSLDIALTDSAGNSYIFTVPNFKFDTLNTPVEGINTTVFLSGSWIASVDANLNRTFQIDIFNA